MMTMTSCVNELEGNKDNLPSNVASLQDQVTAMKSSVLELESIQTKLNKVAGFEEYVALFEDCATSVKEHVALVENGLSGAYAAVAAMKLQGQIADAAGTVNVALAIAGNDDFQKDLVSLEKSVSAWLGKDFKNYFGVLAESARLRLMIKSVDSQTIAVEALASDVEAGLRVGDASSLEPTLASVNKSSATLSSLNEKFSSLSVEIEEEYTGAIKAESSVSKSTLKAVNTKAVSLLADAVPTLDELASRIADCETEIAGLKERLTQVETDIEKLLGLIQSVSFLSKYSTDVAVAYYNLNPAEVDGEGKMGRTPVENVELNYIVRPAAAVTALADMASWAENGVELNVKGYFAELFAVKSFDNEVFDFTINSVSGDAETGVLTVNVDSDKLSNDFFMKNTGAKVALSIQSATTDIASKFVELVPKDESGTVYIESMTLDARSLEIKQGDTDKLTATLTPTGVTVAGCEWSSSVPEVASIDENGNITANIVGTTVITATTKGTNEWGQKLTATCNIKVAPNVKIIKPQQWVETWADAYFTLQMSDNFAYTKIEWSVSNDLAQIDNSGKLTGLNFYHDAEYAEGSGVVLSETYRPTTVYCKIYNGGTEPELTLEESIIVVAKQPRGIDISGLSSYDDPNRITLKFGEVLPLGTMSVTPNTVNSDISSADDHFYVSAYNPAAPITYNAGTNTVTASSTEKGESIMRFAVQGKTKYFAPDHGVNRWVTFVVEPYYVEEVILPETWDVKTGDTFALTADFVSDDKNKTIPPTYTTLTWSSDNDSVVSIDANTGKMTALSAGNANITATTSHEYSVPEGQAQKSATCFVTVNDPTANDPVVGDYYYSNGTWGDDSEPEGKTVIGVVFSVDNPLTNDLKLRSDYSSTISGRGLVLGTEEYSRNIGYYNTSLNSSNVGEKLYAQGYITDVEDAPMGYSNTKGMNWYATNMGDTQSYGYYYAEMFRTSVGVPDTHESVVNHPSNSSSWYVPSYYEMYLISGMILDLNEKLSAVGGDQLSNGNYWMSSFQMTDDKYYDIISIKPFDMSTRTWGSQPGSGQDMYDTKYPVRVVLAF